MIGILIFLFIVLGFAIIVPFTISAFQDGLKNALTNVVDGIIGIFLFIWQIIILPFTLIRDIFNLIAKLFKR